MIPAFLLNPTVLVGIALALALAWGGVQTLRLDSCQARGESLVTQNTALGKDLERQNTAITDLEKQGKAARAQARQLQISAAAAAQVAAPKVEALQAEVAAPAPAGKTCADSLAEVRKLL